MSRPRLALIPLLVLALGSAARAQLIGPIPPATPPTPEYVPPPPGPKVDVPETAPIAPSIVERDDRGRVKALRTTPEEAAVARYPLDDKQREKVSRSAAARQLDLDRFVANNVEKVLAARAMESKVSQAVDYQPLFEARDAVAALRFEGLLERLVRDQAITVVQRNRLEEAVREYDKARKDQIEKDTGGDPTRTAVLVLRQTYEDSTREPFASLEKQINDFINNGERTMWRIEYEPGQRHYQPLMRERPHQMGVESARAELRKFFLEVLTPEQRRWVLVERLAENARDTETKNRP